MEGEKGKVCVTGGTGFIASWLIMKLLQHGYSVNATIRSHPQIKKDIRYLTNLPGASERLQIFKADLSEPQSFDAAIEGCIGVFHVAHPVDFEEGEPQETVIRRSVEGTLGILKGCLKSKTVKRVVYTSSTAAVVYNNKDEDIMDESSWSDIDVINSIKPLGSSYVISKTRIERAALEFAEQHGLDLVSLIPSFVVGPFICPGFPGSVHLILAMILGNQHHYQYLKNTSMVHVDDVASAHIFLLEYPDAKGRYICSSDILTLNEMSELLSAKYPQLPIPTIDSLKEIQGFRIPGASSKKLLDAGFKYKYGVDEMFEEAIQCCKEKGFLNFSPDSIS
ncbi:vestitone reductase [Vitis vinifera]|uniref:Vestitone reductase n=2 Tax=Vitis vinifera TaxID=29760 RepID=A0A438DZV5_VITVI|nr:vestitone reductase [Vitis vinifera]RVW41010.1 Vestitone reductase [Vitis vinifera]RVW41019.1 Vestitone reductase [Vitis vinifera]|eukprot:XP_002278819.1 PREDICTED: vestitone reductase [Vitis vinifera]